MKAKCEVVPAANADALAQSLRDLEANDLHVMVTRSSSAHQHPTMRSMQLRLHGEDLNLLRVFDVVMVERNVTRAATRLAMTQPAVSNALRRLRDADPGLASEVDLWIQTLSLGLPEWSLILREKQRLLQTQQAAGHGGR